MSETTDNAKALREEVHHLFGVSWDRFIEWAIITWLSAWIWTAWIVSNAFITPDSGPISWISDVITTLGGEPPAWLLSIPIWLADPHRAVLLPICVVTSAILATLSLRSFKLTGLRVLALAGAAIAVEIDGSMLPLLWIVLVAAIPCVVSMGASFLPQKDRLDDREWSFFYAKGSMTMFAFRVVGLYAMPVAAPFVLSLGLVFSYRIEREYNSAQSLGRASARELAAASKRDKSIAESDPLVLTSALVSAIASALPTPDSQRVAAAFDSELHTYRERPLGATGGIGRTSP